MNDKRNLISITVDEVKDLIDMMFNTNIEKETININVMNSKSLEISARFNDYHDVFINTYGYSIEALLEDYGGNQEYVAIPFEAFKYIQERFIIED